MKVGYDTIYSNWHVDGEGGIQHMKKIRLKLTLASLALITLSVIFTALVTLFASEWFYYVAGYMMLIVIAAFVSYQLADGMIKPLKNIMIVARQISLSNYHARVKVKTKDEFGQLAQAINHMASNLEVQMKQIRDNEHRLESVLGNMVSAVIMIDHEQNIVVANRSAERIFDAEANELLGKKFDVGIPNLQLIEIVNECIAYRKPIKDELVLNAPVERVLEISLVPIFAGYEWLGIVIVLHDISEIRRLERVRSEFVANVSHELKTPIASVKGFTETLLRDNLNDKEIAKSFLQIIFDESERLNRLINDILQLSKIESSGDVFEFEAVDLSQIIKSSIQLFAAEAEKKKIEVVTNVQEGTHIEGYEGGLRQIIINLVSNAVTYMPHGGRLLIQVDQYDDTIRIIVEDTGIGIPKKDLPRIFERFYLVDKARSRHSGGTGLGLSIVKHLVELHGGNIKVKSELAMGTQFTIDLPVIQES